jgi:hypothetical protein
MDRPNIEGIKEVLSQIDTPGNIYASVILNDFESVIQYAVEQEQETELMGKEIAIANKALNQTRSAFKLAVERLSFHMGGCPAEIIMGFNSSEFKCHDNCDVNQNRPLVCWIEYFMIEAQRQLKEGNNG